MEVQGHPRSSGERGAAALLLLFAMSAFSVLGLAAFTSGVGGAQPGQVFNIFTGQREGMTTKFVAPFVVPNAWRVEGANGSYSFDLPVMVPENGNEETAATSAWHPMTESEVPGVEVCCETTPGVCAQRKRSEPVEDWTPTADNALQLSLRIASHADSKSNKDQVLATVIGAAEQPAPDASAVSCQLEFHGKVIAKGMAHLRQTPRQDGSDLLTDVVEGTFDIAARAQ
jgi:hypothetical protein